MSSNSSPTSSWTVTALTYFPLEALGRLGRMRIRRGEIGERLRRRPGRPIDAVPDDGAVAGVDDRREQRVDHLVVGPPAAAGLVRLPREGGQLDLQERAALAVGLGDVDDE